MSHEMNVSLYGRATVDDDGLAPKRLSSKDLNRHTKTSPFANRKMHTIVSMTTRDH